MAVTEQLVQIRIGNKILVRNPEEITLLGITRCKLKDGTKMGC